MPKLVRDPDIIAALESDQGQVVTDPATIAALDGLAVTAPSSDISIQPKPKSMAQAAGESTPEMIGGMAGGMLTASKGTLPGFLASTVGGAGGEGFHQVYQHIMGSPSAPQDVKEAAKRMAIAGGVQGAGEVIGRGIIKAASPFAKYLSEDVELINKYLGKAMSENRQPAQTTVGKAVRSIYDKIVPPQGLTPSQATENMVLDTLDEVAAGSFTGGETMRSFKAFQKEGAQKVIDNFIDTFGKYGLGDATPEQVGIIFRNARNFREKAYRKIFGRLYGSLDDVSKGTAVDITPLKTRAAQELAEIERRRGIGTSPRSGSLLKKITELDDTISFRDAHDLRSAFMDEYDNMASSIDPDKKGTRIARQFARETYAQMESAAKKNPAVFQAWRKADESFKAYQEKFNTDFMGQLAKIAENNPEKVVPSLFRPKAITQIRQTKEALPPKAWDSLKSAYLRQIMLESENGGDILVGHNFKKKLKTMGTDVLDVMFDKKELQGIYNIATMTERMQQKAQGGGGMLIKLVQAGGITGLGVGIATDNPDLAKSGAVVFLGPWALSKLMTNRVGQIWLTKGLMTSRYSKEAAKIGGKLLTEYTKIKSQDPREGEW